MADLNQNFNESDTIVSPTLTEETLKDTENYSSEETSIKSSILEKIISTFKSNGIETIGKPVFELYDFPRDENLRNLSQDYNLNAALSRYYTTHKRSYGNIDVMIPEAECVRLVHKILKTLDVGSFVIKLNHKKVMDGILETCGASKENFTSIYSSLNKLDKFPWKDVRRELIRKKGLTIEVVNKIGQYVQLNGKLKLVQKLLQDQNLIKSESAFEGLKVIQAVLQYCHNHGATDISFNLSFTRRLNYFTGITYEALLLDESGNGDDAVGKSLASGGHYDSFVGIFNPKCKPYIEFSIRVENIIAILESKPKIHTTKMKLYVVCAQRKLFKQQMEVCKNLSEEGFQVEQSHQRNEKLVEQLQHCRNQSIPWVIILDEYELQNGVVIVRNVKNLKEEKVPISQLCEFLEILRKLNSK